MILIILDKGRFVVVHMCSSLSLCCCVAPQKILKIRLHLGFLAPWVSRSTNQGDIWSRRAHYRFTVACHVSPWLVNEVGMGYGNPQIPNLWSCLWVWGMRAPKYSIFGHVCGYGIWEPPNAQYLVMFATGPVLVTIYDALMKVKFRRKKHPISLVLGSPKNPNLVKLVVSHHTGTT